MIKSKKLRIKNINFNDKPELSIGSKPYVLFVICTILSLCLLFYSTYIIGMVMSCVFISLLLFSKNKVIIEAYKDMFVFYIDEEYAYLVYYDEIKEHKFIKIDGNEFIAMILNDDSELTFRVYNKKKLVKELIRFRGV